MEQVVHSADGQLITGSFMDYAMPRAHDFPSFLLGTRNVPTTGNRLGVKGGAETGTVGIPPAIISAILDAFEALWHCRRADAGNGGARLASHTRRAVDLRTAPALAKSAARVTSGGSHSCQ